MNRAKSCAEIADELGTSRQNTNQVLKRALGKLYNKMLYEHKITSSSTETLGEIIKFFQINTDDDVEEFYKLLPNKIKQEVWQEHGQESVNK